MKKILIKTLKVLGILTGVLLIGMMLFPVFFPHLISDKIKKWTNDALTTPLNFSDARLSFFDHFPSLTLTLHDVSLMGSAPYAQDPLLKAKELAFGIDLRTVFSSSIHVNEIYLDQADITVRVDHNGNPNYHVYKSSGKSTESRRDSSGTALKIEGIQISNSNLLYQDSSVPFIMKARNLNYTGSGNFSQAIFDLSSRIRIDSFDLNYGGTQYVKSKKIRGRLITRLNTESLQLEFKKNNLVLNSLPVKFTGTFSFLTEGYDMDLKLSSQKGDLGQVLSALPPEYDKWLENIQADGRTSLLAYLKGKYVARSNLMPDLGLKLKINDGSINYQKSPAPIKNLLVVLTADLPSLNPDSLHFNLDTLNFTVATDYFRSMFRVQGLHQPTIHAQVLTDLDLSKWSRALGITPWEVRGHLNLQLSAEGTYATRVERKGIRQLDTLVASIPRFQLHTTLRNGYIRIGGFPQAITPISFDLEAANNDGNYHHTSLLLNQIDARMLSDYVRGYFKVEDLRTIDADFHAMLHLENIQKYYPLNQMDLAGNLHINVVSKGEYLPSAGRVPVTRADFSLQDAMVRTPYYPNPVTHIQMEVTAQSTKGSLTDLQFAVKPISFQFEGQPFQLKADLSDFHNIQYNIHSKGILDIGKLYQVFAIKGLSVKGLIKTHLFLRGLQSDAEKGLFDRLHNSGTAELKDIALTSEYFPNPFFIQTARFRFDQDQIRIEKMRVEYGKSTLNLEGYLSNIISYATSGNAPLEGQVKIQSGHLYADEFTAYSTPQSVAVSSSPGVFIIPPMLNLRLNADLHEVSYQGIALEDFQGGLHLSKGTLTLDSTSFKIIGAPVTMKATYQSISPLKAHFSYLIDARNFDIHRAYREIALLHTVASSAAKAEGVVSLQYQLEGRLNAEMKPVYPSLKGNGVLSLKDVKIKGMRLFGALGKAANRDSLNNPHLKDIEIKTSISHNLITIDRTRLRIFGFRPRFEGQVSFDGKLDLSGRLGLPPLGIIGIPFSVTGTQENPRVKLRKSKASDKLVESPDDTEVP